MTGPDRSARRGLVLGGGGVAGIAWETALVTSFQRSGIDLEAADVVVGTSAGSVVGTALRSGRIDDWYRAQLEEPASEYDAIGELDVEPLFAAVASAEQSRVGQEQTRATLGDLALTSVLSRTEADSLERFGALLPTRDWPSGDLRITAVDAIDGSFVVFDANSGVDLVHAVAASCAVPGPYPTITIGGRPYMDGGMRSSTNADVAAGCDRILVIACGPSAPSSTLGPTLTQAVAELRRSAEVMVIEADEGALAAFGNNSLLLSTRDGSYAAGARQAAAVTNDVLRFWGSDGP